MRQSQITLVRVWSFLSCGFAVALAVMVLQAGGKNPLPMPAYLGYLWIGLLGGFVANALAVQEQRIAVLERKAGGGPVS